MSTKKLPKINRSNAVNQGKSLAGGKYDFVFSDNIDDWCHNRQLTEKRNADNKRNNGNRKHFSRPTHG